MDNAQFPSNSHRHRDRKKSPTEEKRVTQIVKNPAVRRKRPLSKRMTDIFVSGDAKSVWGFVALDVLVPAAKDALADAASQGVERMIFGEARSVSRRTGRRPGPSPYVSYNRYSSSYGRQRPDPRDEPRRPEISRRGRATHDFDEIVLATRVEAEEVLDRLYDLISKYDTATVSDLYDLVGISGNYTDDKWGWFELRGADITRIREGYLLDLPRPEPLD